MNQSMTSQLVVELPLHVALLLCGAFGYMVTRWLNERLSKCRRQTLRPWQQDEEDAAMRHMRGGTASEELLQAVASETTTLLVPSTVWLEEEKGELLHQALQRSPAGEARSSDCESTRPATRGSSVAAAAHEAKASGQQLLPCAAMAAAESCSLLSTRRAGEAEAEVGPAVSARVASLLAKKAERKARKLLEKKAEGEGAREGSSASAPASGLCGEANCRVPTNEQQLACIPDHAGAEPRCGDEDVLCSKQQLTRAVVAVLSEAQDGVAVASSAKKDVAGVKPLSMDTDVSTADEGHGSSWDMPDIDSSDHFEKGEEDTWGDDGSSEVAAVHEENSRSQSSTSCFKQQQQQRQQQHPWAWQAEFATEVCNNPVSHGQQTWSSVWGKMPAWGDSAMEDGWMLPFDEMLEQRAPASREWQTQQALAIAESPNVTDALACGGCYGTGEEQLVYQPVFTPDGQQLYTDGEQFFVLPRAEAQDELTPELPQTQAFIQMPSKCTDDVWEVCWGEAV